ncbi:hypothetical protein IAR50_001606 [Cryptococcus sp. DSM 104548]
MNRSLRLLKPQVAYAFPSRPIHTALPSNLSRPLASPAQAAARLGLASPLQRSIRAYATEPPKEGKDTEYREAQAKTPSAASEVKGLAGGFAQVIAGGSVEAAAAGAREQANSKVPGSLHDDFVGATAGLAKEVPKPAMVLGMAGTIPYFVTSLGTVFLARQASIASAAESINHDDLHTILTNLHTLEHAQITYGATLLSFLGAIHWGFEFSKYGGEQGYKRLALGVAPVLFAWPTTFLTHGVALAAQWCGFTGAWFIDQRAATAGLTPPWYSTYRFYLSLAVGFSIIATLSGTSFYGAGAGASVDPDTKRFYHTTERVSPLERFDRLKERYNTESSRLEGKVKGDVYVEEDEESFLRLRNPVKEEEQRKEAEEEKKEEEEAAKKKEEEQKKKDAEQAKKSDQKGNDVKDPKKGDGEKGGGEKKEEANKGESKDAGADDQAAKKKEAEEKKGAAGDPNTGMKGNSFG